VAAASPALPVPMLLDAHAEVRAIATTGSEREKSEMVMSGSQESRYWLLRFGFEFAFEVLDLYGETPASPTAAIPSPTRMT